jgi:alginate O-acetyltransferase complex protein AlgI
MCISRSGQPRRGGADVSQSVGDDAARRAVARGGLDLRGVGRAARRILAIFFTFHYVCLAWIFFRAPTFDEADRVLRQLGQLTWHTPNLDGRVLLVLGVAAVMHFCPRRWFEEVITSFTRLPAWLQALAAVAVGLALA